MNNYSMKVDLSVGLFARIYVKENGLTVADPGFRGGGGTPTYYLVKCLPKTACK